MTFVNEKILPADQAKNGFTSNSRFYVAQPSQWTVDRARDMFLVHRLSFGPGGTQSIRFWAFKWNGQVFESRSTTCLSKRALMALRMPESESVQSMVERHRWSRQAKDC